MMRYFYLGLGILLLIPAIVEAQIFDGQVDVENWARLVNQPVVIRTERGLLIDDHNFQALVADKKTKGIKFIEIAKGKQERKFKVEDITSLSIGLKDFRLRFHFPTATWHLIDQDDASAKANSRLEKVNEEWTKARSLAENTSNDDDAREFAKDLVTKIGPTRVKLHENEHVLLITNLPPASANVLLASFPKMTESVHRMFGVAPEKTLLPAKPVVGAFNDRLLFGEFCVKGMDNNNYGDAGTSFQLRKDRLCVVAYSKEKDVKLGWEIIWCLTGAVAYKAYSTVDLPSWMQVGLQQYMADKIVPANARGEKRDREETTKMIASGTLNGLLDAKPVDSKRHLICKSLVRFMVETNQAAFSQTLLDIKAGISADESIKVNFGATRQQMLTKFGQAHNVPLLRP